MAHRRPITDASRASPHHDRRATWRTPADIKAAHRNASFLANNRVVFNIKGNDYRLVVAVRYTSTTMFIRFVGTHAEYDKIDAETI
ncbi:MAG: type II toxin-antitoxin system HigB family toxin [Thauera sp.]|nr:type II toxin-antitoxin system HigB family toxin [Thauera sp.]